MFPGFTSTKPFKKSVQSADSPMYAVDCEMVCLQVIFIDLAKSLPCRVELT